MRYTWLVWLFASVVACSGQGGCGGCNSAPLPAGGLPADQTVEGGAQIRVTPSGWSKLEALVPGMLNEGLAAGFCMDPGRTLASDYCFQTQDQCAPGCKVNVHLNSTQLRVTNDQTLNIKLSANATSVIPIDPPIFSTCMMTLDAQQVTADLDVAFAIDPQTGELAISLKSINDTELSGVDWSGCGVISFLADIVTVILDSFLGDFVIDLLKPTIEDAIKNFLPNPLGVAGITDMGELLGSISPTTEGQLETRLVPGGFVSLQAGGMALGVITGFNADRNPATRAPDVDNEVASCVPPFAAPDFAAAPSSLPRSSRQNFMLAPADVFLGAATPANTDLLMGISETSLDQLGHHVVTSGGMCMAIGTAYVAQLTLGTFGLLVPSLAELASERGNDPMLIVLRPQRPMDVSLGEGTDASPSVTLALQDLELDVYAYVLERYVRAFTIQLTLNAGLNVVFEQQPGLKAKAKPVLVGISSKNVQIKVRNNEFVRESTADLERILPSILDLLGPQLANIAAIEVPSFAGLALRDLRIQKVTTREDDFLTVLANLGDAAAFRARGNVVASAPAVVTATAMVHADSVPAAAAIRAAYLANGTVLPTVNVHAPSVDAHGRALEWSWNLNGGLWRPFRAGGRWQIRDAALLYQGKYSVGLIARVAGDYRTTSLPSYHEVVVDSEPPRLVASELRWRGSAAAPEVHIVSHDLVANDQVEVAIGAADANAPTSGWQRQGSVVKLAGPLADAYAVYLRDPSGNLARHVVRPHGGGAATAAGCQAGGANVGLLWLLPVMGLVWRRRARLARHGHVLALATTLLVGGALMPACSCGKQAGQACEEVDDCAGACGANELPFCIEHTCICADDIPPGRVGAYLDVAAGRDGSIWVSAYAQAHGDLVVAKVASSGRIPVEQWEWVDGVPDVPPVLEGSKIRRGIDDAGPDVGMYTSLAVNASGEPMVTYFDRDTGSLRFATKQGDAWSLHVVDAGTGPLGAAPGEHAGLYTALVVRGDTGVPGVAYGAQVIEADGSRHAEVRYAEAKHAMPRSADDWTVTVIERVAVAADASELYPLPMGVGLFVDAIRNGNGHPIVAYYDRGQGDLKLASYDAGRGAFAAPRVLDGQAADVGVTPSLAIGSDGRVRVAYAGAQGAGLRYIDDAHGAAQMSVIDDGYRIVGMTADGLPKPEFHFVGDDVALLVGAAGPVVYYQDATTHELLVARRQSERWQWSAVAGAELVFQGAYGFYTAATEANGSAVVATMAVSLPTDEVWVEVFTQPLAIN